MRSRREVIRALNEGKEIVFWGPLLAGEAYVDPEGKLMIGYYGHAAHEATNSDIAHCTIGIDYTKTVRGRR